MPKKENNSHAISVVVPVYAHWASLKECIQSLSETAREFDEVILINDSGPEAEELESNIKRSIKNLPSFHYYRNSKNKGFVFTCNRGVLKLSNQKNDVIVLNSDTRATPGWLEEMSSVLYAEAKIGAVSPRSNNATIFTVPLSAASQKGIEPAKSYQLFTKLQKRLPRYNETPTAHGFCMLARRSLIKEHGFFDKVYGMGYCEENDFSMRLRHLGYKCVMANRAFVYHMEATSFTSERKQRQIQKNRTILDRRYPEYTQLVRKYISEAMTREEGGLKNKFKQKAKLLLGFRRG